jgi:hypothetical protein
MAANVGRAGIGEGVTVVITFAVGVSVGEGVTVAITSAVGESVFGGEVSVGTSVTAGVQATKMVARSMMIVWAFTLFESCF